MHNIAVPQQLGFYTKVALVLTILIIGFVGYLTVTHKDMKGEQR